MDYAELIPLLEQLKDILRLTDDPDDRDYLTVEDVLDDIDWISEGLEINDQAAIEKLQSLFAPAGILQVMAVDNGWSDIHLEMAKILDGIMRDQEES